MLMASSMLAMLHLLHSRFGVTSTEMVSARPVSFTHWSKLELSLFQRVMWRVGRPLRVES
ncbi:hypothetical protein ASG87_03050 [Frateuria sp. Soil773]|nr:hypothetical protein ASG87_03050 [Frateuria sp. Soil773]